MGNLRREQASGQPNGQSARRKPSHASRILCCSAKDAWMLKLLVQFIVTGMLFPPACMAASSSTGCPPQSTTTTTAADQNGTATNRTWVRVTCGLRPALPSYYTTVQEWMYDAMQPLADADIAFVEIVPEAARATDPCVNVSVRILGGSEAAMQPLLTANTSWLQGLEAAAAAGKPLPSAYLPPRPGALGGPTMAPLLLFYRRDWWAAVTGLAYDNAKAAIPPTWPRLVALLEQLHQLDLDLDGDGKTEHVLCVDMMSGCKGWSLLAAIYASMMQTRGTSGSGGLWFNPAMSMRNRVGGAAMAQALQLYGSLAAVNAREYTPASGGNATRSDQENKQPNCTAVNALFASGRCLFTIDWATAALHLDRSRAAATAGRIGVVLLPGSTVVQDETAPDVLTACTAATCPRAELHLETMMPPPADQNVNGTAIPVTVYTRVNGATGNVSSVSQQQLPVLQVNRVPLLSEVTNTWLLVPGLSAEERRQTEAFMSRVGFKLGLMYGMMFTATFQSNVSETSSYLVAADSPTCDVSAPSSMGNELTHLVVPTGTATAAAAQGILNMDPEDVRAVVLTTTIALTSSNKAYDIMMPYSCMYRTVLDNMALEALALHGITGATTAAATAAASSHWEPTASDDPASASSVTLASVTSPLAATSVVSEAGAVLAPWSTLAANGSVRFQAVFEEFPYPNILKQAYLHALPPVGENVTVVQEESKRHSLMLDVGLPLIVGLGCSVLALIVATVVILRMLRNRRLKVVRPPGPGPATTLVVSDIQNSTLLWEVLPSGVMDVCLGIHHSIIRKHLVETRGYELSTEGDAFAVAFLCPSDALAFAMDTQVALLHADWPPSLLEQVDGCELWVQPSTDPGNRLETGGSQELGPTRGSSVAWWRENSDAVPLSSPLQLGRGGSTAVRPLPSRVVQLRSGGTLVSGTSDVCSSSVGEGAAALGVQQLGSISAEGGSTVNEVSGSVVVSAAVRTPPGILALRLDADGDSECAVPLAVLPKDTGKKAAAAGEGVMSAATAEGRAVEDDNSVAVALTAATTGGGIRIPTLSRPSTIEESGDTDHDLHPSDWRRMVTWDAGLTPHHSRRTVPMRQDAAAATPCTSPRPELPRPPRIRTSMSLDRRHHGVLEAKLPHNDAMPSTCTRPLGNARRSSSEDKDGAGYGPIPSPTVTPGSVKSATHGTQPPRSGSLRRLIRDITFRSYRKALTLDLGTKHHGSTPSSVTMPAAASAVASANAAAVHDIEMAEAEAVLPLTTQQSGCWWRGRPAPVAAPPPAPAPLPKNSSTLVEPACSASRSRGEPGERFLTPFTAPGRGQPVFDALWHSVNAAGAQLLQSRGFGSGSESGRPSDLAFDAGVPDAGSTSAQWLSVEALLRQLYSSAAPNGAGKASATSLLPPPAEVLPLASGAAFSEKAGGLRPPPQLVLRGLRVRMGIHADLQETEVTTTLRDGVTVTTYTGEFMATCKDICDSAMGGVVLLSGRAFQRYQELRNRDADSHSRDVMLLNLGEHVLQAPAGADGRGGGGGGGGGGHDGCGEDANPYGMGTAATIETPDHDPDAMQLRVLYCAVSPALMPRMAVLPSLVRTFRQVVPGCLSAPAAAVAPVFCNVVGIESLLAWEKVLLQTQMLVKREGSSGSSAASGGSGGKGVDTNSGHHELAATAAAVEPPPLLPVTAAMELLRRCANDAAQRLGGYLVAVSGDAGHWVLVFGSPESAILWGLEMLEAMLAAEWPEGFLDHDLTEEVWRDGVLTKRGLRLRIGIDFGRAMVRLVPRTGKLDYVGRPMNRAARIAAKAKAASMLVSGAAWGAVRPPLRKQLTAVSLGKMQLKGVAEQLELLAISWNACPARAGSTNSKRGKDDGKEKEKGIQDKDREEMEDASTTFLSV